MVGHRPPKVLDLLLLDYDSLAATRLSLATVLTKSTPLLARQPGDDGRRYKLVAPQRSDGRNLGRQSGRLAVWQPPDGGRAAEFAGGRTTARRGTAGRAAARAGREIAGVGR